MATNSRRRKPPERLAVEEQYSAEQVANKLAVDVSTVWRAVKLFKASHGREGLGPARKLGRRITRFSASAVNAYLRSREV